MPMARDIHRMQYTVASRARKSFTYVETSRETTWERRWGVVLRETVATVNANPPQP